jgi:hypothetical protein
MASHLVVSTISTAAGAEPAVTISGHSASGRVDLGPQCGHPCRRDVDGIVPGHGELCSDEREELGIVQAEPQPADGVIDVVEVPHGGFATRQRSPELLGHRLCSRQAGHAQGRNERGVGDGVQEERPRLAWSCRLEQWLAEADLDLDGLLPSAEQRRVAQRGRVLTRVVRSRQRRDDA